MNYFSIGFVGAWIAMCVIFVCMGKNKKNGIENYRKTEELELPKYEDNANEEDDKERIPVIKKYPIRLMFGIGDDGFFIIYECEDGSAESICVYGDEDANENEIYKIKFTNEDSFITLDEAEDDVEIKEIVINRQFQSSQINR
jgi:hypothetical protein